MKKNDRVKLIGGRYKGRTGLYVKDCTAVFPEWCRVLLDLKPRQKNQELAMVLKVDVEKDEQATD